MNCFSDNYSRGCQICQQGKWLCIYLTYLCPGKCNFCPSPSIKDEIVSAFGNNKEEILPFLNKYSFNGIGFSGGDPFVKFSRLVNWLYYFKTELPEYYFWAYTSGISIKKNQLDIVSECGLDELRFNIAATNYKSKKILDIIEYAVKVIPKVAIEIPSISSDIEKLYGVLPILDRIGVKYLNLHEYLLVNENQESESSKDFVFNIRSTIKYSTLSQINTKKIIKYCKANQLGIKVNNCDLMKKEEQIRKRRLKMGQIFKTDDDTLDDNGFISRKVNILNKFNINTLKNEIPNLSLTKFNNLIGNTSGNTRISQSNEFQLKLIPPLSVGEDFYIIEMTEVGDNDRTLRPKE